MDWNDLRLFAALARTGGLAAAARDASVSAPTLGRRVQALEAALGKRLVDRTAAGYRLTADGRALAALAEPMEAAALAVTRWRDHGAAGRVVRISSGTWTSRYFARHIAALARPGDPFRLEFLSAEARLDIARRAADIGLRDRRPEEAWLAGRRLGRAAYAFYARPGAPDSFVASSETITRPMRWLRARHGERIAIEVSPPFLVLELALAGAGRALLPCFVGEAEPQLARIGGVIDEIVVEQWLVMHHEDRHEPAIRAVAGRIAALLRARRADFIGPAAEAAPAAAVPAPGGPGD